MSNCAKRELRSAVDEIMKTPFAQPATKGIHPSQVLGMMPRGLRFLFLDEILEVDRKHISARYRFREDEFFYEGHFPDRPVTPGSVLLEAMCQCGITAHSYYLMALEMGVENASKYRVLFTDSQAEWFELVSPGSAVFMHSELLAWRARRIRARVTMRSEKGSLIAQSVLAGTSVCWEPQSAPYVSLQQEPPNEVLQGQVSLRPASEEITTNATTIRGGSSK
jgi:3-hydroxyacyl-[acyl-carrier-protein] dehydratase